MILRILAAAFAVCIASTVCAAPPDLDRFQTEVIGPSVSLPGCAGTIAYSGEGGTYVLTARHCTKGREQEEIPVSIPVFDKTLRKVKDEVYYAEVNATSFNSDLSALKLLDNDTRFSGVGVIATLDAPRRIGEPVWTVGYPAFPTISVGEGTLGPKERAGQSIADQPAKKEWQRAAINLTGGNSGGALWRVTDMGRYEALGVATAGIRGSLVSIFVTLEDIHEFLKRLPAPVYKAIRCDGYRTANRACPQ